MKAWTGGCLCGAIRYEATPEKSDNWYCHCRMCQRWTGSVVSTDAVIPAAQFRFTQGEPKYYRSSPFAERGFCDTCGSSLVFRAVDDDRISIQTGTLDDPEIAPPAGHYGIEGRIGWFDVPDGLPRVQTGEDESSVTGEDGRPARGYSDPA